MDSSHIKFARISFPEQRKTNHIGGFINTCIYRWPLFLVSIILMGIGAFYYLSNQKAVYQIKATLLLQDINKTPGEQSALHEIDLSQTNKIIENEIEVLKSRQIITRVIDNLNLTIDYSRKNGHKYDDLYKSTPIELVKTSGKRVKPETIILQISSPQTFTLEKENHATSHIFDQKFRIDNQDYTIKANKNIAKYIGSEIKVSILDHDKLAQRYQTDIDISPLNKLSTTILLTVNDVVPERGKDILDGIMHAYQQSNSSEQSKSLKTNLEFLEQRIASIHGELTNTEGTLSDFKSTRGLTDLSSDSKVKLENMQSNDMRLNDINVQLGIIEGIEKYMNTASNSDRMPVTLGISDPALNSLIERLSQLQLQREKLLATTPENNPAFQPLNRQIALTRNSIKDNIGSIKTTLLNTLRKLNAYSSKYEKSIKNIPVEEQQFINIKRQQAIKENLYTYLLQKKEEVSMNYASTLAKSQIIDNAYAQPLKKNGAITIFALAVLIGLILPGALIYLRSNFNGKVTDIQDLKAILDFPILSEIAQNNSSKSLVISADRANETSEQFRALRTRISHLYGEKKSGRVTLVTSSMPGEGKSFISTNLASALASVGRKTLLLELDLRKPQVSKAFDLPKDNIGVTEVLQGKADLFEALQTVDYPSHLHILTSGAIVSNPSDLLESEMLKDLIADMRNHYDDIIIDSPPILLVADAMILSPLVDMTLYTIRQGQTDQGELVYINELHQSGQLVNVNLVFNGIQRMRYGYGLKYDNTYNGPSQANRVHTALFKDFSSRF
jgi:tyrosine-protein kinase Etk/Wzc